MPKLKELLVVEGINCKGFGMLPKIVMLDGDMTLEAKTIYAYLCSLAGNGTTAFPARDTIVRDLGINKDTYYKHFKYLKEQGYLTVSQKHLGGGRGSGFTHNVYTLVNSPEKFQAQPLPGQEKAYSRIRFSGLAAAGYGTVPRAVMVDDRLDIKAKGIYAYFCTFTGSGNNAFPKCATIMRHLKIGRYAYFKYMDQLETMGYIFKEQRNLNGQFQVNDYYLNSNPEVLHDEEPCADFSDTQDSGIEIPSVDFSDTQGWDTKIPSADFSDAQDWDTEIPSADFSDAQDWDTRIPDADFSDTQKNGLESEFLPCDDFSDAQTPSANFSDAQISDTNINNIKTKNKDIIYPSISYSGDIEEPSAMGMMDDKDEIIREIIAEKGIPYWYAADRTKMEKAIRNLGNFDYFIQDSRTSGAYKDLLELLLSVLTSMCCAGKPMELLGSHVEYSHVIKKLNGLLEPADGGIGGYTLEGIIVSLADGYFREAESRYIRNHVSYLRSFIWSKLTTQRIVQRAALAKLDG